MLTLIHPTHTHTLLSAHRESLQLANRLANTHTPDTPPLPSPRCCATSAPRAATDNKLLRNLNTHGELSTHLHQETSQNTTFRQSKNYIRPTVLPPDPEQQQRTTLSTNEALSQPFSLLAQGEGPLGISPPHRTPDVLPLHHTLMSTGLATWPLLQVYRR